MKAEATNYAVAALQDNNFQQRLLQKVEALNENDTYYQSFYLETFRFRNQYEFYIPGVTKLWETRYQMKSQRGENIVQSIIRIGKTEALSK